MKRFLFVLATLALLGGLWSPAAAQAAPRFQTVSSKRAHSARHHHAHKAAKHHRPKHGGTV